MRKVFLSALCALSVLVTGAQAEEVALLKAKSLQFTPTGGVASFLKESGTTNMPNPTCPGTSSIRLSTSAFDSTTIPLNCLNWKLEKGKFIYTDANGTAGGVQSILWKSTRLTISFGGANFNFSQLLGPVGFFEVRLTVGPDQYGSGPDSHCARFTNFTVNLGSKIQAEGPSQACGDISISSPTPTVLTNTPTPAGPTYTPTISPTPGANPPKAFRFTSLSLQDPGIILSSCGGVANSVVTSIIAGSLSADSQPDGILDLNFVGVFRPLTQPSGGGNIDVGTADCTAPVASTSCHQSVPTGLQSTTYTNTITGGGQCVGTIPGTLGKNHGNTPYVAIQVPQGPCFSTPAISLTFNLGGIVIPLSGAQFAGEYNNNPATLIQKGLIRGFISEATAASITIPMSLPLVGGKLLTEILQGANCPANDDRDMNGAVNGWWFYLNYTATEVPWTSP